jgi:hypothetical protein
MDFATKEGVKGANEAAEQLRQLKITEGVQEYGDKMEVEGAPPSSASSPKGDTGV